MPPPRPPPNAPPRGPIPPRFPPPDRRGSNRWGMRGVGCNIGGGILLGAGVNRLLAGGSPLGTSRGTDPNPGPCGREAGPGGSPSPLFCCRNCRSRVIERDEGGSTEGGRKGFNCRTSFRLRAPRPARAGGWIPVVGGLVGVTWVISFNGRGAPSGPGGGTTSWGGVWFGLPPVADGTGGFRSAGGGLVAMMRSAATTCSLAG
jgi:hypothetical protein